MTAEILRNVAGLPSSERRLVTYRLIRYPIYALPRRAGRRRWTCHPSTEPPIRTPRSAV